MSSVDDRINALFNDLSMVLDRIQVWGSIRDWDRFIQWVGRAQADVMTLRTLVGYLQKKLEEKED